MCGHCFGAPCIQILNFRAVGEEVSNKTYKIAEPVRRWPSQFPDHRSPSSAASPRGAPADGLREAAGPTPPPLPSTRCLNRYGPSAFSRTRCRCRRCCDEQKGPSWEPGPPDATRMCKRSLLTSQSSRCKKPRTPELERGSGGDRTGWDM